MSKFIRYLRPWVSLEECLWDSFSSLHIDPDYGRDITSFLEPLRIKDRATYEHSIRVGLMARAIGRFMHLDAKALFYAGVLHDIGKAQTDPRTLSKTSGWTEADMQEIMAHVMDGYRLLRGRFDFSAEVILWHHQFKLKRYPIEMPQPLHDYSRGTRVMIPWFGRMLALADDYDAMHRVNDKFKPEAGSIGETIKRRMLESNPDQRVLVLELYVGDIFTTRTYDAPKPAEPATITA